MGNFLYLRGENPQECSTWWSQLPNDFQEDVLALLPPQCSSRYRGVCEEWNVFLSSTKFNNPWLVMCCERNLLLCMAYCFVTKTWKSFSFPFLSEIYLFSDALIHGSAAGLFLVSIYAYSELGYPEYSLTVCNPLTGTSLELLSINNVRIQAIGIMEEKRQGQTGGTYKVIMVVNSDNAETVEIYDSSLKSWRIAGHLPQNLKVIGKLRKGGFVISEDFFYCLGRNVNYQRRGIVAFSVQNGTFIFLSLPLEEVSDRFRREFLFTCGSRLFIASIISDAYWRFCDIIISEFEKPKLAGSNYTSEFKEITRLPPFVLEEFERRNYSNFLFDLEGIGDLVCIKCLWADDVLVYNLTENIWRWLPTCPTDGFVSSNFNGSIFAFYPSLDMRVE